MPQPTVMSDMWAGVLAHQHELLRVVQGRRLRAEPGVRPDHLQLLRRDRLLLLGDLHQRLEVDDRVVQVVDGVLHLRHLQVLALDEDADVLGGGGKNNQNKVGFFVVVVREIACRIRKEMVPSTGSIKHDLFFFFGKSRVVRKKKSNSFLNVSMPVKAKCFW